MYIEKRKKIETDPFGNSPEGWAKTLRRDPFAHHKLKFDPRWKVIRKHMKGRVLDAGCGRGEWVDFLAKQEFDAVGVDYSSEMISANTADLRGRYFHGSIQDLPFGENEFDGIISWGVIEHDVEGPNAALVEFHRVLKKGGVVLATVPVDNAHQRAASENQIQDGDEFFQYFFTADELATEAKNAGFEILQAEPIGRPHPALVWPKAYVKAKSPLIRLMQIGALFKSRDYTNMVGVLAMKVKA